MRWRTEHTTGVILAVALLFPATTVWIAVRYYTSLGTIGRSVGRTQQFGELLQGVDSNMFLAASDARTALQHHDAAELEAYRRDVAAMRQSEQSLDAVSENLSDRRLGTLRLHQAIAARAGFIERALDQGRRGDAPGGLLLLDSPPSLEAGRAVRAQIVTMQNAEQQRLAARRNVQLREGQFWLRLFSIAGICSLVLLIAAFIWLELEVRRRRRTEEELSQSNLQLQRSYERYNRLIEHIPSAVWSMRQDGVFDFVSARITQITGYTPQQVTSSNADFWRERLHPDDLPAVRQAVDRFFEGRGPLHAEFRLRDSTGEWIWLQVQALDVTGPPGHRIADGVVFDVTARRQLEEAERLRHEAELRNREIEAATRMKTEFIASVSHELRTPLSAVLGFSELLLQGVGGPLNEEQLSFADHIQNAGQHLLGIVTDVVDLARIEAGQMQFKPTQVRLEAVCQEAIQTVSNISGRKSIQLKCEVPSEIEAWGDALRIRQIMFNLLGNALKFTPEGGTVRITARALGGEIEVSVIDTGIGIAPENLNAIFERFQQVTSGDTPREGAGLGLAITRQLVAMHHGRIWAESEPGQGARFVFTLPRQPPVAAGPSTAPATAPAGARENAGVVAGERHG